MGLAEQAAPYRDADDNCGQYESCSDDDLSASETRDYELIGRGRCAGAGDVASRKASG